MLHDDYKRMFNEIIDNNLTILQTLDDVEGLKDEKLNDKARRNLEKIYKTLRENLKSNIPLTATEILFLGAGVNLTLASLKKRMHNFGMTLKWYNAVLVPAFKELQELEDGAREILVDKFYKKFEDPITFDNLEENSTT